MQSIDSTETCTYGTIKDITIGKEKIKLYIIQKCLTSIVFQKKTEKT